MGFEVAGGWLSGSLALLAEAGHMLSAARAMLAHRFGIRHSTIQIDRDPHFGTSDTDRS